MARKIHMKVQCGKDHWSTVLDVEDGNVIEKLRPALAGLYTMLGPRMKTLNGLDLITQEQKAELIKPLGPEVVKTFLEDADL